MEVDLLLLGESAPTDSAEAVREGELQQDALDEVDRERWNVSAPESPALGELGACDEEGEGRGLCSFFLPALLASGERERGEFGGGAQPLEGLMPRRHDGRGEIS